MEIKIKNFKLNVFRNLMEQSLIVDNQLMFEFSSKLVRSCSFSTTKSFMKLWTIPLENLITPEENKIEGLEDVSQEVDDSLNHMPTFNVYILKGDLFKKFLSVHTTDTVDLIFNVDEEKKCAASLTVNNKKDLVTTFVLTTEELITNKIDDYSTIIKECTPSKNMFEFTLSDNQIQEIKRLIKKLHKSNAENTAYLTFTLNPENQSIAVNDKVFTLTFNIDPEVQSEVKFPNKVFSFNILKSDFIITGNQTFSIYTNEEEPKVIFGARYAGSIIWCLSSKITESSDLNLDASIVESTIDSLDMDEYIANL